MRVFFLLASAVLWQMAFPPSAGPAAAPQHMQYLRSVGLPHGARGQACAVLDAPIFAHATTAALNDLRLYAKTAGVQNANAQTASGNEVEVPFNLTESEAAVEDDAQATVEHLGTRGGDIVFDLAMPQRPYTAVVLDLAVKNFLAVARVTGSDGHGGKPAGLGSFTLFDLSRQHLSRSTTLPLQESTFPVLHLALHFTPAPNTPRQLFAAGLVQGASVPPSREAQTLYTTVARTSTVTQRGHESVAVVQIPAHVPVERIAFTLAPGLTRNFLRSVTITASPDASGDGAEVETFSGDISHVHLAQDIGPSGATVDSSVLDLDDTIGANLRSAATVSIAVENGNDLPLPLASVALQMRRREICFDAARADTTYTLMYGDPALHAPVYDYARLFVPAAHPIAATLGPERRNPNFVVRDGSRPYSERHPELLWIVLLAVIAVLGSIVLRRARNQNR